MRRRQLTRIGIALPALALLASCGGAPTGSVDAARRDAGSDVGPVVLTDIEVRVTSSVASFDGRVLVGAFRMDPPTMPPVALARLTDPTFPVTATLRGVEPGTYWVTGILDFDPPSPTIPGAEDTTASFGPIEVPGDATPISVELALSPR